MVPTETPFIPTSLTESLSEISVFLFLLAGGNFPLNLYNLMTGFLMVIFFITKIFSFIADVKSIPEIISRSTVISGAMALKPDRSRLSRKIESGRYLKPVRLTERFKKLKPTPEYWIW